jgi:hypothetical protein
MCFKYAVNHYITSCVCCEALFRISVASFYVGFPAQRVTTPCLFYSMTSKLRVAVQKELVDGCLISLQVFTIVHHPLPSQEICRVSTNFNGNSACIWSGFRCISPRISSLEKRLSTSSLHRWTEPFSFKMLHKFRNVFQFLNLLPEESFSLALQFTR